ncbi:cytochrome oxidase assembly [Cellulophaga geojensis KL-A]|uniref:Cytochrome oxidase assembly n=1 Tax=Cellulophaga geojensis KL-A TaxID=1328323 RepID=A0ABN0RQ72_9FLAO|nr:COX15/CtaA family protein [Cellulophaga geojensis]EWH14080.1 cytochrome oxidase assembly [Cellulophaga geojensis KL-A]
MQKTFIKTAKLSLILVYLVIIAGAVVRMTGSGMGCPDWPKCFGQYIPPTNITELQWQPFSFFKKGEVIIVDKTLQIAAKDFTSTAQFNTANWETYTKHDYATFNATHTWIEYINRLFGALAGLATLVLAILSLKYWKTRKTVTILSWAIVFAMVFQAWLGATVVYSVLNPIKITVHMVMALAIVAMLLYLIYSVKETSIVIAKDKKTKQLIIVALVLTLLQIVLGTQVRQMVDDQADIVGETAKHLWLKNVTVTFYIHRSFSILVLLLNAYLFFRIQKLKLGLTKIKWVLTLLLLEIVTGVAMNYVHFPFGSQTLHLVLASLLFGVQYYMVLELVNTTKRDKTL